MKKLALAIASLSIAAAPVFACPHEDKAQAKEEAPRTAENGKKQEKKADDKAEKKEAPKTEQKDQKAEKAPEKKAGEKVSAR
jgi:hypothetical protein